MKEIARLKVESKKSLEMKEALEKELFVLETTSTDMEKFKVEPVSLRDARDEVDHTDLQRRMDVLTEFGGTSVSTPTSVLQIWRHEL